MYGSQVFNLNLVMSGIILLCIMSTLMYYGIVYLEKKITLEIKTQGFLTLSYFFICTLK